MVRDKNNNDKLILGNIDSSPGTRSSNLCIVNPIKTSHSIAFCPQLDFLSSIYSKVVQRPFLKHVSRKDNTATKH